MTRRERMERRAERRREWAEKADGRSAARLNTAHEMASVIPMGQPILVGHYSETRDRRYRARIDSNMRKGIEESDKAARHRGKAAGIEAQLANSIFSDDEDALEQLAEKIAKLERQRDRIKAANRIVRRKPKNASTPEKLAELAELLDCSQETAAKLFEPDCMGTIGFPSYKLTNLGGNIRRAKQRIEEIKQRNARSEAAADAGGVLIEGDEWVRVTFEEKPDREILTALKAAGFRWGGGSWTGQRAKLPEELA